MKNTPDYRESHTEKGKGKVYHTSFAKYPYRRFIWEWEQVVLKDILDKKLKHDSNILDFACGTGRVLDFLKTQTLNVTGVDISPEMLETSKANHPELEIIQADLTRDNIFLGKRTFDVISSFRFFLNAQNTLRLEALKALHPLLKDDGIFIFNNHGNSASLGLIADKMVLEFKNLYRSPEKQHHINLLSHSKMKSLLSETGFEIVDIHHRSVVPVMSEKTSKDVSKLEGLENWFSSRSAFRSLARNIIYVCKKV